MAEFQVNIDALQRSAGAQKSVAKRYTVMSREIRRLTGNLNLEGSSGAAVKRTLQKLSEQTSQEAGKISKATEALSQIAVRYQKAEAELTGATTEKSSFDWKKVVKNFGPLGGTIAVVGSAVTGDWWGAVKGTPSVVGGYLSAAEHAGEEGWGKYLFGFNTPEKTGFGEAIGKEFEKYSFKDANTVLKKGKVVAKWAGAVMTVAGNGYENYKEFKGQKGMAGRAVAETVIESAVDIGLGVATGALMTTVGAPACAAGVAVWAANGACKWVTGKIYGKENAKDIGEVVADGLIDGGKYLARKAGPVVKTAANKVKTVWKSVANLNPFGGRQYAYA